MHFYGLEDVKLKGRPGQPIF